MVKTSSRNLGANTLGSKRHPPVRETIMTRSQLKGSGHSGNFLRGLPTELFHMVLDKLSGMLKQVCSSHPPRVLDISIFSLASKEITRSVLSYVNTWAWRNKAISKNFHNLSVHEQRFTNEHFRDLGLLFKRCTMLLPTKERLKFTFDKCEQVPCFMLEQCMLPDCSGFSSFAVFFQSVGKVSGSDTLNSKPVKPFTVGLTDRFVCFAKILNQTLIAGWDEYECHRVFVFLCDLTKLPQKMESVITDKPGTKWYQELQLRHFCRRVVLDPCLNHSECQFWLMRLLKPWPIVHQAHLLYILFGPLLPDGTISWQGVVERGVPHNALVELARAVLLLYSSPQVKGWAMDSTLAILEELIVIPQPWHVENVARLLVLCGSGLCYTVLATKALSGRVFHITKLIVFIILVCEKDGYQMSWAVNLVQQVSKIFSTASEKFCFFEQLENMFSEVTREFYEFSLAENHLDDRETFQTLCILLNSSARFHTKLLYELLK